MSSLFSCPYLNADVELSNDRERHIAERHPDLLPAHRSFVAEALAAPDEIRRSARSGNARLFSKWYDDSVLGRHVVVVVVSESTSISRHWIITAYTTRKLSGGEIEWKRD